MLKPASNGTVWAGAVVMLKVLLSAVAVLVLMLMALSDIPMLSKAMPYLGQLREVAAPFATIGGLAALFAWDPGG